MQKNSNLDHTAPLRSLTSRFYETERDLQQMQALLMEARSRADDWHYWHVGDLTWGFFILACHLKPQEQIRLWHDEEGKLVAYAVLGEDPSFDCQVLPEYEWSGIESEAVAWAKSPTVPQPSARCGIRGSLARSATMITRASCACPASSVSSMW